MRKSGLTLVAAALAGLPVSAHAAQLKVYVSGAMAHAIQQIAEEFAKKRGDTTSAYASSA